jgi:hypothetical protein
VNALCLLWIVSAEKPPLVSAPLAAPLRRKPDHDAAASQGYLAFLRQIITLFVGQPVNEWHHLIRITVWAGSGVVLAVNLCSRTHGQASFRRRVIRRLVDPKFRCTAER